jgi:uncharacterized membrane protein
MNLTLSVPSFIFDDWWPVGAQQNSSFPLFPWCRRLLCILAIRLRLRRAKGDAIQRRNDKSRAMLRGWVKGLAGFNS